jgi:hypothetical protein
MTTSYLEKMKLRGDLTLTITNVITGRVTRQHVRNTITYAGMNSALYLWTQDTGAVTDYRITQLVPGTNSSRPTRGDLSVVAPVDTASRITLSASNRSVVPATGELIITATLDTTQGNVTPPLALCEVGLVLGNGDLFARQVHAPFQKTNAFTLTYSWRIAVTA